MRAKLTMLSLSPVCLFTLILNFRFVCKTDTGDFIGLNEFFEINALTLIIFLVCIIWLSISAFFYIYFKFKMSYGGVGAYSIQEISEDKEAGLNFFVALIVPFFIGSINEWQNFVAFIVLFVIIFILLVRTNLFYANPVLAILGYHIYRIKFKDNKELKELCIVLSTKQISKTDTIEYKALSGNILFAKVVKQGNADNEG